MILIEVQSAEVMASQCTDPLTLIKQNYRLIICHISSMISAFLGEYLYLKILIKQHIFSLTIHSELAGILIQTFKLLQKKTDLSTYILAGQSFDHVLV